MVLVLNRYTQSLSHTFWCLNVFSMQRGHLVNLREEGGVTLLHPEELLWVGPACRIAVSCFSPGIYFMPACLFAWADLPFLGRWRRDWLALWKVSYFWGHILGQVSIWSAVGVFEAHIALLGFYPGEDSAAELVVPWLRFCFLVTFLGHSLQQ